MQNKKIILAVSSSLFFEKTKEQVNKLRGRPPVKVSHNNHVEIYVVFKSIINFVAW